MDYLRGEVGAREELARATSDAQAFIDAQTDRVGRGDVTLPDGTTARRIPGFRLWIWDGEFSGVISLRWLPGTSELPPYVLFHDSTLTEIARPRPASLAALAAIPGVGRSKLERYGAAVIALVVGSTSPVRG